MTYDMEQAAKRIIKEAGTKEKSSNFVASQLADWVVSRHSDNVKVSVHDECITCTAYGKNLAINVCNGAQSAIFEYRDSSGSMYQRLDSSTQEVVSHALKRLEAFGLVAQEAAKLTQR